MIKAYNAKKEGKYPSAKFQGYMAAVLSLLNLIYTGIVTVLVIGLTKESLLDYIVKMVGGITITMIIVVNTC